jgi:GntR family transcriptional repressor for pyruvate dehydrogenase complex
MFETAKQTKVFQDVVEQIQEAIFEGRLKTGDMLPAERELKEMFRVSRGTLREALRVLEQKGLIEIRLGVGGGSQVKQVDTEQVSESLGLLIRSQRVSLNHLAEFREDLEGIVAAHAARLCSQRAAERLNNLLQEAKKCVRRGTAARNEFIRADKQLHLQLARITGNPIYISVLHSIHDNIHRYYDRFLSMDRAELEENYQDLHNIVQAVIQGKPHEARTLAQDHVRRFNHYMQEREQQEQIAAQKRD